MNNKTKIKKGDYGYLNHQRIVECIKTAVLFAAAIAVFLIGYINTGKKENVFTVIAILGMLPASRNAVTCIMFFRFKTGSREVYEKVSKKIGAIPVFYDSVLTTTKKSYPVNVFSCAGGNLLGYSEIKDLDCKTVEKHLKDMAKNNQIKGLRVKIFTDLNKYLTRLDEINQKLLHGEKQEVISENTIPEADSADGTVDERTIDLIRQLSL